MVLLIAENKLTKDVYEEKEKDENNDAEGKAKDEVVFIQDVGFSVKIVSPGAEPFDIQVRYLIILALKKLLKMD